MVLSNTGNEHRIGAARLAIAIGIGCVCYLRGACVALAMKLDVLHLGIGRKFGVEAGDLDNKARRLAFHRKVQRVFRLCLVIKSRRHQVCFSDFVYTALVCWKNIWCPINNFQARFDGIPGFERELLVAFPKEVLAVSGLPGSAVETIGGTL